MSIVYDASAKSGRRYIVQVGNQVHRDLPATVAERLLRAAGLKCGEARERLAMARLDSASHPLKSGVTTS
jgi:hypothetical protein